ncbi:MAG TPA: M18 family aminopeptidase [Acidimicrobiales bacterium]
MTTSRRLCAFIDAAPSPYHAAAEAAAVLEGAGFARLEPGDRWPAAGSAVAVRGGSLVAVHVPEGCPPDAGFRMVGAHTDSPNLRVKPRPDTGRAGFRQLGVEVYGSPLLNSWLDRDLGLSGRVSVRTERGAETRLVKVDRPVARLPQLAIHLDREVTERGLVLDRQLHLSPVWGLGRPEEGAFAAFLAKEVGVGVDDVLAWDVMFHDTVPAALVGPDEELVSAPRLDNLCSCFCAVTALAAAAPATEDAPLLVCLFDHEEVGSTTSTGADGTLLPAAIERSVLARDGTRDDVLAALSRSVLVSADMAHATHPNYAERHEPSLQVALNGGPVVKLNANQRYATDAETHGRFVLACERAGVPYQRYVNRTDLPCGSTIGPLAAARAGISVVDVGAPQLGMHSARELGGAEDPEHLVRALTAFLGQP